MAQAIDPVCGMTVDTETVEHTSTYQGQTYYFCAPGCKKAFAQDPQHYLSDQPEKGGHEHHHHH